MGCSRGVPGLFRGIPDCSGDVPGVFRGVLGCSGCVPGFTDTHRSARFKFQKLRESRNMKNRTIKKNISIQICNQKCKLLYHGFPTKSTA